MSQKIKSIYSKNSEENKEFFKLLFTLSIPIIIQNLFNSSVNLVDTMMVGQLGDTAVAAVGLSNQVYFIYNLFYFGIASGASIFIAQFWGKKDLEGIHRSIGTAVAIIIPISLIFMGASVFAPRWILSLFAPDETAVLNLGAQYLPIVACSYTVNGISFLYATAHRNTENAKLPLYSTTLALTINVILNYLLIFGIWIFPEMGVRGAALATTIARVFDIIFLLSITYIKKTPIASKIKELFNFSLKYLSKFIKTSLPVFLTEALWGFGTTLYFAIYGRISTDLVAAVNISKTIENFFLIFFWGFAAATAAMLGKLIGEHQEDKAQRFARKCIVLGLITGVVLGIALFFIKDPVLSLLKVSKNAIEISHLYLLFISIFMIFRGTSPIITVGILRSGGDTTRAFKYEVIPLWLVCLPLACLVGLVFKMPLWVLFAVISFYEILRFVPSLYRALSGKWVNNLVDN